MKILLICFVFCISETLILDFLTASFEVIGRSKLRLFHFIFLFILSALKFMIASNRFAIGVFPLVTFLILFLSLKKIAGLTNTQIIKVFILNIVISFFGDMSVTFVFSNLVQEIVYPFWNSFSVFVIIVLSNSVQVMAAFMIKTVRKNTGKQIEQEKKYTEQMTQLIILFQFVKLVACFFYEMDKYRNLNVTVLLFGHQICFSIIAVYLILKSFHDDDVKRLQNHLEMLELQNRLVYQYYQELEEDEQKIHRIRHDFNNLMYATCTMANQGDFEMADEIIKEMEKLVGSSYF